MRVLDSLDNIIIYYFIITGRVVRATLGPEKREKVIERKRERERVKEKKIVIRLRSIIELFFHERHVGGLTGAAIFPVRETDHSCVGDGKRRNVRS